MTTVQWSADLRDLFPIYPGLADMLATTHVMSRCARRDRSARPGTCAGYAYADADTVSTMMTRLGLPRHASCKSRRPLRDAHLLDRVPGSERMRSRVIVCFRGTEPARLGNWLAMRTWGRSRVACRCATARRRSEPCRLHRNLRATLWATLQELTAALGGRSLADHEAKLEYHSKRCT